MSLQHRIRAARLALGLSQQQLAGALGISQSTVALWEAGRTAPRRALMPRLAAVLRTTVNRLEAGAAPARAEMKESAMNPTAPAAALETENPVIAFQGVPGAYSHLACNGAFPGRQTLPCATFEDAFAAVEDDRAGLAMIPIENSLGGRVADIHHLLPESNLFIVAEYFQPVHHYLLGPKGATLEGVKQAHSHTQALAQCRNTLRELKIKPVVAADTAGAAKAVAERNDPAVAAVGSSLAAETYGLEILRPRIEDRIGNVTRFVVMSRRRIEPDPRSGPCLTSFVFTVRSVPASLYKSLGGFATNGVNMIKLESYISVGDDSRARFYAEIEGHPADKPVDRAMEELQFFTTSIKVLGVYPQSDFRHQD
jgi:prephenate dehydratase